MAYDDAGQELESLPLSSRIVSQFLSGPLPVLFMVVALLAGAVAIILTPREEEPQIVVPLADVFVNAPGLSAEQVERQVSTPLEKLLYQIDGVDFEAAIRTGAEVNALARLTDDCRAGIARFLDKDRDP